MSNIDVLSKLGLAHASVEVRILRLRWLQSMLVDIHNHELFFTVLFGQYEFETHKKTHTAQGPTNPWVTQMIEDIQALEDVEDAQWIIH